MKNIILWIFLLLIISGCYKPSGICGTCRVYVYEYNDSGNFRKSTITEQQFCNDDYKSDLRRDTLEKGWYQMIQKECL